ncbi:hypothetical protein JZ751_021284, partial [Albula glossodonta]
MRPNGEWDDASCDARKGPFICYDGDPAQRYILIKEKMTWREAQSYCREHHTDLASVRNQAENQEIQQTGINAKQTGWVWIGLFKESWKWSDQSSSSYRYWRSGEPNNAGGNEGCAEVRFGHSGKWNDRRCDEKQNFICYGAHVWLGLRYSCALHFWFWVSGEGVCYLSWAPGNETGECGNTGAVESGGGQQWVSLPEKKKLNFICAKFG